MKPRDIFSVIKLHLLLVGVVEFALIFTAFFFGCQQKTEEPKIKKPQVTIENLQTAYGKSVKHNRMYLLFVKQAEKERLKNTANLYKALARSEEIHSSNHAKLLHAQGIEPVNPPQEQVVVGKTLQTLKMALSIEEMEYESMYPNMIRSAELEKCTEASTQFQQTKESDARHGELVKEALTRSGKITTTVYYVCPSCGYIITSEKTEECPVCKTVKTKFEKI